MADEMRKLLGERLKAARLEAGMSQEEACELMGVTRQAISSWERGAKPVPVSQLVQFAITYVCCAHQILFGESFQKANLKIISAEKISLLMPGAGKAQPDRKRVRRKVS
jgi:transcriptional regulator with XRE-family HTH domain